VNNNNNNDNYVTCIYYAVRCRVHNIIIIIIIVERNVNCNEPFSAIMHALASFPSGVDRSNFFLVIRYSSENDYCFDFNNNSYCLKSRCPISLLSYATYS